MDGTSRPRGLVPTAGHMGSFVARFVSRPPTRRSNFARQRRVRYAANASGVGSRELTPARARSTHSVDAGDRSCFRRADQPVGRPSAAPNLPLSRPERESTLRSSSRTRPAGQSSSIPDPKRGPLLLHADLRNCTGRVPAFIEVRPGGEAQWGHGPDRGCLTP